MSGIESGHKRIDTSPPNLPYLEESTPHEVEEDSSFLAELTLEEEFEVLEEEGNSSFLVGRLDNRVIKVLSDHEPAPAYLSRITNQDEPRFDSARKAEIYSELSELNKDDASYNFPEVIHQDSLKVSRDHIERYDWLLREHEGDELYIIETEFVEGTPVEDIEDLGTRRKIADAIKELHDEGIAIRDFGDSNIVVNEDIEGNENVYFVDLEYSTSEANEKDVYWDRTMMRTFSYSSGERVSYHDIISEYESEL